MTSFHFPNRRRLRGLIVSERCLSLSLSLYLNTDIKSFTRLSEGSCMIVYTSASLLLLNATELYQRALPDMSNIIQLRCSAALIPPMKLLEAQIMTEHTSFKRIDVIQRKYVRVHEFSETRNKVQCASQPLAFPSRVPRNAWPPFPRSCHK